MFQVCSPGRGKVPHGLWSQVLSERKGRGTPVSGPRSFPAGGRGVGTHSPVNGPVLSPTRGRG